MKMPSRTEFQRWAKDNQRLAEAVAATQAYAQMMREKVDAYTAPIYDSFGFVYEGAMCATMDGRRGGESKLGKPMPKEDFFMLHGKDESPAIQARVREYYLAVHAAHIANGYPAHELKEVGYCPASIAETLVRDAEYALLQSGCELLGLDDVPCRSDLRKRMLDILMEACISSSEETSAQQTKRVMARLTRRAA